MTEEICNYMWPRQALKKVLSNIVRRLTILLRDKHFFHDEMVISI